MVPGALSVLDEAENIIEIGFDSKQLMIFLSSEFKYVGVLFILGKQKILENMISWDWKINVELIVWGSFGYFTQKLK